MANLIEWKKLTNSNGIVWLGFIGGAELLSMWELVKNDWIFHFGGKSYNAISPNEAKAKTEELLAEWLKQANLIVKPTKCRICSDDGEYIHTEGYTTACSCRTDPKFLWYFNNITMKED